MAARTIRIDFKPLKLKTLPVPLKRHFRAVQSLLDAIERIL